MNLRPLMLVAGIALLAGCASTRSLPNRPNEREWGQLSASYESLETLRRSATLPPANAPRRQRLEVELENFRRIEPVYTTFVDDLKAYYDRTGDPRAAQLYAREKVWFGDQYMDLLARYDRAINLYQAALAVDPSNGDARRKLAIAQQKRFVSMETFSQIRPGMSEDDVRRLVGMPREDWIRQVVQKGRAYSVWIYPKEDGGASAVYFDNSVVYHTNWNAAPARAERKPEGEGVAQ